MRTNPRFWSDGFEIVDDPDFTVFFNDELDETVVDDALSGCELRHQTPRQRLEERLSERQLRDQLGDWDYWDEFPAAH